MRADRNRLFAASIICQLLQQRGSLSTLIPSSPENHPELNLPLIQELCFGVCRWYYRLNYICNSLMKKPLREKDLDIHCLILIGLYQLLFMRTPAHAAINETVSAVKKPWAKSLVNAVLREAQRKIGDLLSDHGSLEARHSHPAWLIEGLKKSWPDAYISILETNNQRAPMTLRVNSGRYSRAEYLELLTTRSIPARAGELSPVSIILDQALPVAQLPGFDDGAVSVQDEASQLAAMLLKLEPGQRVLDACSAPGGKTCAMLEMEPKLSQVVALDKDESRLSRVKENLSRIGLSAQTVCADVTNPEQWWDGQHFDRILLDMPCSATGVIRRHPDIKLLRKAQDISVLCQQQAAILNSVWPILKPGGYLLYSTCSTLMEENSDQIVNFIEKTPNANLRPFAADWGQACVAGRQLLPAPGNHDGFYYALLQKC